MDENAKAAFIMSQTACALIEALGMISENMQREQQGLAMAYSESSFSNLINEYGIGHNAVISYLRR